MRRLSLVSVCVVCALRGPSPADAQSVGESSFAVGLAYARALGAFGAGIFLDRHVPVRGAILGGRAGLGVGGEVTYFTGAGDPMFATISVHPHTEWQLLRGRVRSNVSLPIQLRYVDHQKNACTRVAHLDGCLQRTHGGVAAGVAAGMTVRVVGPIIATLNASMLWHTLELAKTGTLRTISVGIAFR